MMNPLTKLITGITMGVAGMYFFDPQMGRRRRALVRDQWTHFTTQAQKQARGKMRDLQNRAQGAMHEMQKQLGQQMQQGQTERAAEGASAADEMQSRGRTGMSTTDAETFSAVGATGGGQIGSGSQADPLDEVEKGPGPGEGGLRAPSRQPMPQQQMGL